jgi:hypothetical protein
VHEDLDADFVRQCQDRVFVGIKSFQYRLPLRFQKQDLGVEICDVSAICCK